jgi:phosphatidylglycerol---prolipoprotein diacylglyceryl transferase
MPDPIALSIGPLHIRWYGLMYLAAFVQFVALARMRLKQPHIARAGWVREDVDDMLFYGVLGVVIGGRLGEVLFYHPAFYFANPLEIFKVWNGGMSFHGGFLGVLLAMSVWAHRQNRNAWDVLDFIAPMVPLGYAFGRIGNFINAELPGRIADATLPWAMIWPNIDNLPRHPSPLYQALEGLIEFVLLWMFARREVPRMAVGGMFCLLSGSGRFITEYFRMPDYDVHFANITISAGQMLSLPLIALGVVMLIVAYRKPVFAPDRAPAVHATASKAK